MNGNEIVSIIIPAYNVEQYIFRGIESAINQTYENIEVVIIDDGSTDSTWDVINYYRQKDERITAKRQSNSGVSSARNHGLKIAKGKYVLFLDADDWLELDTVEKLLQPAKENSGCLICMDCFYAKMKEDGTLYKQPQGINNQSQKLRSEKAMFTIGQTGEFKLQSACYKLFDKEIIIQNGLEFDEKIFHGEDGLFVFEYMCCVELLIYENLPLWNILERPGSATTAPYNQKWLTAITAVEKMISHENISIELINHLRVYLTKRTMWTEIACVRTGSPSQVDIVFFRGKLKENKDCFFKSDITFKEKLQYIFLLYVPLWMMKAVLK